MPLVVTLPLSSVVPGSSVVTLAALTAASKRVVPALLTTSAPRGLAPPTVLLKVALPVPTDTVRPRGVPSASRLPLKTTFPLPAPVLSTRSPPLTWAAPVTLMLPPAAAVAATPPLVSMEPARCTPLPPVRSTAPPVPVPWPSAVMVEVVSTPSALRVTLPAVAPLAPALPLVIRVPVWTLPPLAVVATWIAPPFW